MTNRERGRYREGELFAVQLTDGGFGLGVVARGRFLSAYGYGIVLCYFFGPRLEAVPETPPDLRPTDTVWIKVFDNQAIENGDWPIIGPHPRFDRREWPIPDFCRRDDVNNKFYRQRLHPDDPSRLLKETRISVEEAARMPIGGGTTFSGPNNPFLSGLLQDGPIDPSKKYSLHDRSLDWARIVTEAQQRLSRVHFWHRPIKDPEPHAGNDAVSPEHAVILYLPLVDSGLEVAGLPLHQLEERLLAVIEKNNAGEFDGDLLGPENATLYMYGPDADQLFAAIKPVLDALPLPKGSEAVKRYGGPGDPRTNEIRVDLV